MSAAQHAAAAEREETAAAAHEAHDGLAAAHATRSCRAAVCWTSLSHPTADHARDAEAHRALAAKHRAAGQALLQAEAQACAGIGADDRDVSPFYHREDIASVSPLEAPVLRGKTTATHRTGARVVFHAVPGLTVEWLQRQVDLWSAVDTSLDDELERYHTVLHLRTPGANGGYDHRNPLRIESAADAAVIDARIAEAWAFHPRRLEVPATADFLTKAAHAIEHLRGELPGCCRNHALRWPLPAVAVAP